MLDNDKGKAKRILTEQQGEKNRRGQNYSAKG